MPQKINIAEKEKTWKIETEAPTLLGKSLGDKIKGSEISPNLTNYEFVITGGSDKSGMPMSEKVEGIGLKRVLLTKGWGMHKHPKKEGKKKVQTTKGLRLRKTVRGKTLSEATSQINLNTIKVGDKPLKEVFPDQNKAKESEASAKEKDTTEKQMSEKTKEKTEEDEKKE